MISKLEQAINEYGWDWLLQPIDWKKEYGVSDQMESLIWDFQEAKQLILEQLPYEDALTESG